VGGLVAGLLGLSGAVVFLLVGVLVFAEDALFVGFVLPGETAAVLGGVEASRGHAGLVPMIVVVVAAAVAGDLVGYAVGRRVGPRLLRARILGRRRGRVDGARHLLARRGGPAVFVGRFVAFLRSAVPALAGAAQLPFRTFLAYDVAGGLVWGAGSTLLGYAAGNSYTTVEQVLGPGAAVVAAVVSVVGLGVWRLRKRRARTAAARLTAPPADRSGPQARRPVRWPARRTG
jgi:membrane protein DedA with SNARE-associated domain